jgi:hypothetical protein
LFRLVVQYFCLKYIARYPFFQAEEFAEIEENDFAEFDFQDETEEVDKLEKDDDEFVLDDSKDDLEAEVTVEDEGPEFSHFEDEDEFVGYNEKDDGEEFLNEKKPPRSAKAQPPLQYANVPLHLRSNWENYYVEILMIIGRIFLLFESLSGLIY